MAKSGRKRGRPPAGPRGERVSDYPQTTVRLAAETRARLTTLSLLLAEPISRVIDHAIEVYVQHLPESEQKISDRSSSAWYAAIGRSRRIGRSDGRGSRNRVPKHRAQATNRALGAERYHVQVLLRAIAVPLLTLTLLVAGISAPPAAQAPQGALRILSREGVRASPPSR